MCFLILGDDSMQLSIVLDAHMEKSATIVHGRLSTMFIPMKHGSVVIWHAPCRKRDRGCLQSYGRCKALPSLDSSKVHLITVPETFLSFK